MFSPSHSSSASDSSATSRRVVLQSVATAGGLASLAGCIQAELDELGLNGTSEDGTETTSTPDPVVPFETQTATLFDSLSWVTDNYGTTLSTYRDRLSKLLDRIETFTEQGTIDDDAVDAITADLDGIINSLEDGFARVYPDVDTIVARLATYQTEVADRFPDETWSHEDFLKEMQSSLRRIKTPQYVDGHFPQEPLQGVILETLGNGSVPETTLFELYYTAKEKYPPGHFSTKAFASTSELANAVYGMPFETVNTPAYQSNPRIFDPVLVPADRRDRLHITVSAYPDPSEREYSAALESVPLVIQRYTDAAATRNAFETLTDAFDSTDQSLPLRTGDGVTVRYSHPAEDTQNPDPTQYHTAVSRVGECLFAIGAHDTPLSSTPDERIAPLEATWLVD